MLEFGKRLPIVRVYFNQKEDYPNVWSIDDGYQANEINVSSVVMQGVSAVRYSGEARDKNKALPVAWIEFHDAELKQIFEGNKNLLIFINNSSDY